MDRDNPPPPIFPTTDNDQLLSDTDIMRSYAIDTLFYSAYYTGDTEEIETAEALHAPDKDQFITAIKKEVHSLISETRTLQPLTKIPSGYAENAASGKLEPSSSVSLRRSPTANLTSTKPALPLEEIHCVVP